MPLTDDEGKKMVEMARATLESFVGGKKPASTPWPPGPLSQLRGVFVTLNSTAKGTDRLRGCIGFPYPVRKLGDAIQDATMAAASEDPRFPPVTKGELGFLTVEVSVLTAPADLKAARRQDLPNMVRVGQDGLIISRWGLSGLLLPQVATEFNLDAEEFLCQGCLKAGLPPDSWLDPETRIQVFQAEVFTEIAPRGAARRVGT